VKTHSIGFRLAAWYFAVFAVGLTVFSIAAWFAMRASVYHAIDDELRDRVRGVTRFMENQISSLSVPEIRDEFREHSVLGPGGDLFQVCDEEGQWLYRSVPLENANVAIAKPASLRASRFDSLQIERHRLRFYSQRIVVNGKPYTVQVAALMNEAFEALDRFRLILLFVTPILLVLASAGGYWLSTRALAPVDDIAHAAQRISIENLEERLTVPATGDQLQRLSETLNAMLSRLELSVRRMKQFTADASHELRAPVSLIRTTAELAVRGGRTDHEYHEDMVQILAEAERTSRLIDSLLLLARADAGEDGMQRELTDVVSSAREAVERGRALANERGIELSSELSGSPTIMLGDGDALRRLVFILIDNAIKYNTPGGSVRVRVCIEDGSAVCSVRDSGIGIALEDQAHIFDRFWRADKVRSRGEGGAGLGLSIARWIVERHQGTIEVTSHLGRSTTFTVKLPLIQVPTQEA